MAKKEYLYRGRTVEELQAMSTDELAQLLPSRERRTLARLDDQKKSFIKKVQKKQTVKTHEREIIVLPSMVGKTIGIHNGKEFINVIIIPEMIGMRLGQLVLTRKRLQHSAPGVGASRSSASASVR